jgi:hypothetical protein
MRTIRTAAAAGVLAVALVGCGTATTVYRTVTSSPAAPAPAASAPAAASGITCADIDADLDTVVMDLKTQDANEQEAWVSGGDSQDLQALINDTANASSGADQLNTDAATFNADATSYLSTNNPDLAPGWETGYAQVTDDINALARDCNRATAPENLPQGGTA